MWSNAREMLGRASGLPIRVASKSVRCRSLLASILDFDPGFRGLMTFTLPETLWLHEHGFGDLLVAYPSADRDALAELARLEAERPPIVMVDSVEQLDLIESAARGPPAVFASASTSTSAGGRSAGASRSGSSARPSTSPRRPARSRRRS